MAARRASGVVAASAMRRGACGAVARAAVPHTAGSGRACSTVAAFPLDKELPGIPPLKPARNLPSPETHVTTLPNGLRVVSEENYGQVSSVGLFVDSGSMYESGDTIGANHFLEILAFQSTANKSGEQLMQEIQEYGLGVSAAASREQFMYRVDALRGRLEESVELLADTVINPLFKDSEIEDAKRVAEFQHMDVAMNPQVVIQDALHEAAFGKDSPLGRPTMCAVDRIPGMSADLIRKHVSQLYSAERMVVAGAGVEHGALVDFVSKYFDQLTPSAPSPIVKPDNTYCGGGVFMPSNPDAPQDFTHVILGFPSEGWAGEDVVVECVMDTLLGGGSSFSAGGPGKGMYSRLYREVLNRYMWVESASAFSLQMADVGLVGMYGAATPDAAGQLVNVLAHHFHTLVENLVDEAELSRARNQLASAVMMNLELRGVLCEDIGRQFLTSDERIPPADLLARIHAVTAEDIQRLVRKITQQPPSMAVYGEAQMVPEYELVKDYFSTIAQTVRA